MSLHEWVKKGTRSDSQRPASRSRYARGDSRTGRIAEQRRDDLRIGPAARVPGIAGRGSLGGFRAARFCGPVHPSCGCTVPDQPVQDDERYGRSGSAIDDLHQEPGCVQSASGPAEPRRNRTRVWWFSPARQAAASRPRLRPWCRKSTPRERATSSDDRKPDRASVRQPPLVHQPARGAHALAELRAGNHRCTTRRPGHSDHWRNENAGSHAADVERRGDRAPGADDDAFRHVRRSAVPDSMSFAAEMQGGIRAQLADCLVGVICQHLEFLPHEGLLVPRCEVLRASSGSRGTIRAGQFSQIANVLQAGGDDGMWSSIVIADGCSRSGTG